MRFHAVALCKNAAQQVRPQQNGGALEPDWTAEGRTALVTAEALEASVAELVRGMRAAKLDVAGTVSVSLPSGMVAGLTRLLDQAREKFPSLAIELRGDNRTIDLSRGDADIALRNFRSTEPGLVARRTYE